MTASWADLVKNCDSDSKTNVNYLTTIGSDEPIQPRQLHEPIPRSIIECEGIPYLYLGTLKRYAKNNSFINRKTVYSSGVNAMTYERTEQKYYRVKAVHEYKKKFWFIPSSYSFVGTLSANKQWTQITNSIGTLQELSVSKCQEICPGYLDPY